MKPKISFGEPEAVVDESWWPHVVYPVTLTSATGNCVVTAYRMGVGCFKPLPCAAVPASLEQAHYTLEKKPHAEFKNGLLRAQYACACAKHHGTRPDAGEVLSALCRDAWGTYGTDFEEWAGNFGYETDPRKAEKVWLACVQTWRDLRALGMQKEEIETCANENL